MSQPYKLLHPHKKVILSPSLTSFNKLRCLIDRLSKVKILINIMLIFMVFFLLSSSYIFVDSLYGYHRDFEIEIDLIVFDFLYILMGLFVLTICLFYLRKIYCVCSDDIKNLEMYVERNSDDSKEENT